MSLLVGQFLKEITQTDRGIHERGWTVMDIDQCTSKLNSEKAKSQGPMVWLIRNDCRTSEPSPVPLFRIEALVTSADWVYVSAPLKPWVELEPDPAGQELVRFAKDKKRQERNATITDGESRRFKIIEPLLAHGHDLYFENTRTPLLAKAAKENGVTIVCVWQYLCLYWQFGKQKKGLRPRNSLAGQKSLRTRLAEYGASTKEKPFHAYKTGPRPEEGSDPGICMTYSDIMKCRKAADAFLFKPSPDHKLTYRWVTAHTEAKRVYYDRANNPANPAPTLKQFIAAVKTDPEFAKKSIDIVGELPHARNNRPLKSTSSINVPGPGSLGAIDDMMSKVVLLDDLTYLPMGTSRVFFLVDVWSGLIAGVHDTLFGSTYTEAMACLYNAFRDKKIFFAEQKLARKLRCFSGPGVFRSITTDNGPLRAALADSLPREICELSNVKSYRPDLKSDVETSFHAYLKQMAENLPGYNRKARTRGDDDPKMLAYLTQREFRILLWAWVEMYNQRPLTKWLPKEALAEENPPANIPCEKWHWGLPNLTGSLEFKTDNELQMALLSSGEGTWTKRRGINFGGLVYIAEAKTETELATAGIDPSGAVKLRFDRNYVDQIFVIVSGKCVAVKLRADLHQLFSEMSFAQVEFHRGRLARNTRVSKRNYEQGRCELSLLMASIKKLSKATTRDQFVSERQRKDAIRVSSTDHVRGKQMERNRAERVQSAKKLFDAHTPKTGAPKPKQKKSFTASSKKVSMADIFSDN